MAKSSPIACFSVLAVSLMIVFAGACRAGAAEHGLNWVAVGSRRQGTMEECTAEVEDRPEMGSEMERRILATANKFISYRCLKASSVPCTRRGASYYNCQPGAEANPYSRGCATITRCRS